MSEHYDVIIIGSGAGGGTLAYRLAPSGARILLLERGEYVRREKDNWSSHAVNVRAEYHPRERGRTPTASRCTRTRTTTSAATRNSTARRSSACGVSDFAEIRHHGGVSPAWPLGYDEIEPYYAEAERLYHVHGKRGEDPTEPPASGPYPHPAISHEPRIQQLSDDFARAGLRPFHVPLGIMLDESSPNECVHPLQHLRWLPVSAPRQVGCGSRAASIRR